MRVLGVLEGCKMLEFRIGPGDVEMGMVWGLVPSIVFGVLVGVVHPAGGLAGLAAVVLGWCAYAVGFGGAALARAEYT